MSNFNRFSFFSHHRINDHVYIVRESFGYDGKLPNSYFFIGVVIGSEKVAVIDAGNGATDGLRDYIEQNICGSGKPIINLLSHNHLDHIGACMQFDARYMHKADIDAVEIDWAFDLDRHFLSDKSDMVAFCQGNQEVLDYVRANYYKKRAYVEDFIPVEDGDIIDLGNIQMEVVHTPTHTRGSCCYYDRQDHIAFTGDAITPNGMSFSAIQVNGESETAAFLKKVRSLWEPDSLVCGGHHMPWGMDLVDKLLEGDAEIRAGINLQGDIVAPPAPFIYKDARHTIPRVPGVVAMRHFHKDVNLGYKTQIK